LSDKKTLTPEELIDAKVCGNFNLGTMLSGFIHDINNPLAVISGQNSILETITKMGKLTDEKSLKTTDKIARAVDRLSEDLERLREVYKINESDDPNTNLRAILINSYAFVKTKLYRSEIEFDITSIEEVDDELYIDLIPVKAFILFSEFFNNAIEASSGLETGEEKRLFCFSAKVDESSVTLRFENNGIVISPESLPHIYDYGFTTKTSNNHGGTGLYIAEHLINKLKGSIEVKSADMTEIVIKLPIHRI